MSAKPLDIASLASMLWLRRWSLLRWGIVAGGVAYASIQFFPPRYASEGVMIVNGDPPPIPELGSAPTQDTGNHPDHTIVDVLHSRAIVENVVRTLNLTHNEEYYSGPRVPPVVRSVATTLTAYALRTIGHVVGQPATHMPAAAAKGNDAQSKVPNAASRVADSDAFESAVDYLRKNIKTDYGEGSRILSVRFEAASPDMAATIVNTLMKSYIDQDVAARRDALAAADHWLDERVSSLRKEVDDADARVQEFRRQHNILQVGAGSLQALQLSNEQTQLSLAQQDLAKQEAALATVQQVTSHGGSAAASQEVLSSPIIQMLRQREAATIERIANAASLGPQHPGRKALDDELNDVQGQIAIETAKIVESLKRDADAARGRVTTLERAVGGLETLAGNSAEAEITYTGLERDAEVKRQTYNAFLVRAEQTAQLSSSQFASARVLSPAIPASRPSPSHTPLTVLFGIIGGMALAATTTLTRQMLGGKVNSTADLAAGTSQPILGSLPWVKRNMASVVIDEGQGPSAETLRALRFNIQDDPLRATTVLVTSSDSAEGKTTIAEALAKRFAADGQRVLLIEGDLRRPTLLGRFGPQSNSSIEAVLAGTSSLEQAVHVDAQSGLHCLLAAGTAANPLGLLTSGAFDLLMLQARSQYQLVVLDSPPVLRVVDPVVLSRWSDVTLFAVRWNRTSVGQVTEALRRFPDAQRARVVMVLNRVHKSALHQRGYYSGYGVRQRPLLAGLPAAAHGRELSP